jgi:hypothetical protein
MAGRTRVVQYTAIMLLTCGACSGTGNPMASRVPDTPPVISGTWTGSYLALCDANCASPVGPPSPNQRMSLVLEQQDDMLSGTLQLYDYFSAMITVTGRVAADGTFTLTGSGSNRDFFCAMDMPVGMGDWHMAVDRARASMTGVFHFSMIHRISSCYHTLITVDATQVQLALNR